MGFVFSSHAPRNVNPLGVSGARGKRETDIDKSVDDSLLEVLKKGGQHTSDKRLPDGTTISADGHC